MFTGLATVTPTPEKLFLQLISLFQQYLKGVSFILNGYLFLFSHLWLIELIIAKVSSGNIRKLTLSFKLP